jgi:hypothetical protein
VARKTVVVSDLSGEQIQDGRGAKVRITFEDARSVSIEMDVTAEEARANGCQGPTGRTQRAQAEEFLGVTKRSMLARQGSLKRVRRNAYR